MSVRENLAFGLKLRKVPKPEIERRVNEAAETIQLQKLLDRKPKELSGGQRQRVALGRAIVREPAVFLMDEPLSNLDAKLRVQTRAEIARLHQRLKTTVVYVTHDQVEAMTMGSRIAVMNEGLLMQVGTPQALYDTPLNRFVAGFIGSPSMNFVDVTVDGSGDTARLVGPGDWALPTPQRLRGIAGDIAGKKLVAGFRPEHLDIGEAEPDSGAFRAPGGRRGVPRQRGAPPPQRRQPGRRRDRRLGASRQARRHRQPRSCRSSSCTCSTPRRARP